MYTYVCIIHILVCMWACACSCVENNTGCFCSMLSILFFEAGYLTDPEAYCTASARESLNSAITPSLNAGVIDTHFQARIWHGCSGPHSSIWAISLALFIYSLKLQCWFNTSTVTPSLLGAQEAMSGQTAAMTPTSKELFSFLWVPVPMEEQVPVSSLQATAY